MGVLYVMYALVMKMNEYEKLKGLILKEGDPDLIKILEENSSMHLARNDGQSKTL